MKSLVKQWCAIVLTFALLASPLNPGVVQNETVYAAATKTITGSAQVVCKQNAVIKVPENFVNCKFSSSNKKVASVNAKGKLKALRLGMTKITVQSGKKIKNYTITVVPASKKDVYLKQSLFLKGGSARLQLASKKYDTSQVSLKKKEVIQVTKRKDDKWNYTRYEGWDDGLFNANCYCKKLTFEGNETMEVGYGSWRKKVKLVYLSGESIVDYLIYADSLIDETITEGQEISYKKILDGISPSESNAQGIKLYVDDQLIQDKMNYTPGEHVFKVKNGSYEYKKKVSFHYEMKDILRLRNSEGVKSDCKEVLDAVFRILDKIITPNMTDEEKVKAIHDYLIYNADYYHGDLDTRPGWSGSVKGVIMNQEGVCNSYALAFYTMTTAVGIPCRMVSGLATNSVGSTGGHAWNQVQLNGKWYYIDCTWDDPTGGGHERYTYYLSENLWNNHTQEECEDIITKEFDYWEKFYLTGEGWDKK